MGILFMISSDHFELLAILPLNANIGATKVLGDPAVQPVASFAVQKLVVTALFHNFLCQSIREH